MTALLTADEAARLRPGEQLVIVRAGDPARPLSTATAPYDLTPVAPQDWVALTGPCPTCHGNGRLWRLDKDGTAEACNVCRDGRRIVPLYTECPHGGGGSCPYRDCLGCPDDGRILVGRGSIEVVPVVADAIDIPAIWPQADVLTVDGMGVHLYRWVSHDHWKWEADVPLDPLPVPGRDWGIVIDCVEVAS